MTGDAAAGTLLAPRSRSPQMAFAGQIIENPVSGETIHFLRTAARRALRDGRRARADAAGRLRPTTVPGTV
jgi:hypothetical protein